MLRHGFEELELDHELLDECDVVLTGRSFVYHTAAVTVFVKDVPHQRMQLDEDYLLQAGIDLDEMPALEVGVIDRLSQVDEGLVCCGDEIPDVGSHRVRPGLLLGSVDISGFLRGLEDDIHGLSGPEGFEYVLEGGRVVCIDLTQAHLSGCLIGNRRLRLWHKGREIVREELRRRYL